MSKILQKPLKVALPETSLLGEGPLWDPKREVIFWVDIMNGHVHEFTPSTKKHRVFETNDKVGAVALCPNGDLFAALSNGFAIINRESGEIKHVLELESDIPENRFNDGKCDPSGRFWVGSMAFSEEEGAGNLYMIDKDLSASIKIRNTTISNGLAWSLDHKILYYIDTPTFQVVAYDFNIETGEISNKRIAISIPESEGFPDGMVIDREGKLWIGHWEGWQLARWDPETGEKLLSVPLPVARVTLCAFGGENLQDLYITTAKIGLTEEQLKEQPLAGSLFVIEDCGYQGLEPVEFNYQNGGI